MTILNEEATVLFAMINPVEIQGDHRETFLREIDFSNSQFSLKLEAWIETRREPVGYENGSTIHNVSINSVEIAWVDMVINGEEIDLTNGQVKQLENVLFRNVRLEK